VNLDHIKNALLTVGVPAYHFEAAQQPDQYIVWAEDGQGDALWDDDGMCEQTITGTTDYFTRVENDPNLKKIKAAHNAAGLSWRLNSIQYEDDTKYIHYEFAWETLPEDE